MKQSLIFSCLLMFTIASFAQNTVASGNWSDPTIWSGGATPAASGTVNVNNPLTLDASLSPTGKWTFNSNAIDQPGGTAYTFNPNAGADTISIDSAMTVSFEGGTSGTPNLFSGGTITVYGTLILGYTQLNNSGSLNVIVEPGGILIINGDLINKNNSGTFDINGALIVNGNFTNQTGSITVGGSGTINTTGSLTSNGGSTIFGTTNDCNTGPCSATALACSFTNTITPVSKNICSGSTAGTLTSVNSATSPTYQWLRSTDDVTYVNASGVSTNSTYVTPALTQTTWYKVKVKSTSGSCTSVSAAVKFTVLPGGGWIGGTSNDWGTASNWCSNVVPGSTTDVVITNGAGIANMPAVNAGTAALCRDLTISNTSPVSSVTIAASGTASLSIFGDFTNNGKFTDNSTAATAGVIMAGSATQDIKGLTSNVFNNFTVNNSSGVHVSANNLAVSSNLALTSGLVNLNGYALTLGTSASSTGALSRSTGSWLYGGSMQRWFPTSAITLGSTASLFPMGDAANYRPLYLGSSGLTSAGGTIKVSHTSISGASTVSFSDAGTPIQVRSNSFWTVATGGGISSTGTPFAIRTEGTGMGLVWSTADLRLTLAAAAAPGAAATNAGTPVNPQVNRSTLSVVNLSNNFYWGSTNTTQTTLPVLAAPSNGRPAEEQGQGPGFILFPNPSDGRSITIRSNIASDKGYALTIFDNLGVVVARSNSVQSGATIHFAPALPPGVYYARLSSTTSRAVQRFVVLR
ncbi:T9SS type A sorting domain-containing protein [Flavitalea sp. BT771]|uniref:T9SS type A sorting domain-containing protein n=1 Tax=Flavitalea sp. BT771 TaxID=3063329 RepID=UPI0026E1F453|nr:T9SS type A sorting domain-containing protein [Flavitalea sp. BT771]MDO6432705.1 T9SS type A sorting domain-containing protein [Flavitalea sp. BT771]MDV6222019.1 T9SS type A sorting domain-containing protein [Flavitalea sp. BT771]